MNPYKTYKLVERLGEITRAHLRKVATKCGLQPVQLEVLHYLVSCNQYSNTLMSIVDYLGQTKGTVSQTIKSLETKGLIQKVPDANDKRTVRLAITAAGKTLVEQELPGKPFELALSSLDASTTASLDQSLAALNSALLETNNMDTFGVCKTCIYNQKRTDGYFCNLLKLPLSQHEIEQICREHSPKT